MKEVCRIKLDIAKRNIQTFSALSNMDFARRCFTMLREGCLL